MIWAEINRVQCMIAFLEAHCLVNARVFVVGQCGPHIQGLWLLQCCVEVTYNQARGLCLHVRCRTSATHMQGCGWWLGLPYHSKATHQCEVRRGMHALPYQGHPTMQRLATYPLLCGSHE